MILAKGFPEKPPLFGEKRSRGTRSRDKSFGLLLPSSVSDDEGRRQTDAKGTDNNALLKSGH